MAARTRGVTEMFEDLIKKKLVKKTLATPPSGFNHNHFENIIDNLVVLNRQNRQKYNKGDYVYDTYIKNYCTVIVDIGRKTGKTHYIKQHVKSADAIIVLSNAMKDQYKGTKADVFSTGQIPAKKPSNHKIIYIDNATFMTKIMNLIYEKFAAPVEDQTFILLG